MSHQLRTLVWALASAASLLHAQDFRATLAGRVLDAGGAAIVGAKVRITNAANAEYRETTTDAQGDYQFPLLTPATYSVKVERSEEHTSELQSRVDIPH